MFRGRGVGSQRLRISRIYCNTVGIKDWGKTLGMNNLMDVCIFEQKKRNKS